MEIRDLLEQAFRSQMSLVGSAVIARPSAALCGAIMPPSRVGGVAG